MTPPREPLFLERQTYRRRRLMDALRFLPFVGAFLLIVPVLWAGTQNTVTGTFYVFGVWLILILLAVILSRRLAAVQDKDRADAATDGDG